MKIKSTIRLPRCWKRLIKTVFEDNLSRQRISGLVVTLANGKTIAVRSEKYAHSVSDPCPYYDEVRTIDVKMPDGANLQVVLCSGQSNYYGSTMIHDANGQVIYECDPMESFDGPLKLKATNGNTYVVEIEWAGIDIYEYEIHKVRFTAIFEATVCIHPGDSLENAIFDIDIPENKQCSYVVDSFEQIQ